ncbi:MAG: glycosyltransferase, partial [Rhodococcus sp. (in: high G+C Gram-positive bacteria)]
MKIGMICPYSFDVPGGVQAHVVDLAEVLIERGHKVSVLAPSSDDDELPDFV